MRTFCAFALAATLTASPVLAQPAAPPDIAPAKGTALDHGPFTAAASLAYQGGGMILQGAPGAPAPVPEPTPPGQTPRNMVPAR
jgi:hypothetical protein